MAKKQIKDKVELEKLIDQYLEKEIPISFLLEEYDLNYVQMSFLVNRVLNFNRHLDTYASQYEKVGIDVSSLPQDLYAIPHEIEELYPVNRETRREQFLELRDIESRLQESEKVYAFLRVSYEEKKGNAKGLEDEDKEVILRIRSMMEEIEESIEDGNLLTEESFISYLRRYGFNPGELSKYQEIYEYYQKTLILEERLELCENEIKSLKKQEEKLKEDITVTNLKLANWVIRSFYSHIPLPKEDAQMVAYEGLVMAINKYDPNRVYKTSDGEERYYQFSTLATLIIKQNIQRHFNSLTGISWGDYIAKINEDKNYDFSDVPNIVPTFTDVFAHLEDELQEHVDLDNGSDYDYLDKYEDATSVVDEQSMSLESKAINSIDKTLIVKAMKRLTPREQEIIVLRYGLNGSEPKTLTELAKTYNLTLDQVRLIEEKSIRKLRHPLSTSLLRNLLTEDSYNVSENGMHIYTIRDLEVRDTNPIEIDDGIKKR